MSYPKGIPAYPKIFTLGMKETERIYNGDVEVTEKIDGSQFSFGKVDGELQIRSKGAQIFPEDPNKMFQAGVDYVKSVEHELPDNTVFHGEYLQAPRHNTLAYDRVPKNHFMLFGVRTLPDYFVDDHESLGWWADRIGCETIPLIMQGPLKREGVLDVIQGWLETPSQLGKAMREGVVIKNYSENAIIGGHVIPVLSAKYVSDSFKEKHGVEWKKGNPNNLEKIAQAFCTEARWKKAVQHLRDDDALTNSPKDIGPLMKAINQDIEEEDLQEMKDELWKLFRKDVLRAATRGFPEWYKQQLVTEV